MIASERGSFVTVNTISWGVIGAGSGRTVIVLAFNGDSPARREDVVMVVSINRLEVQTAKNRRDREIVAIGQMHNGGCHDWVVCWRGQKIGSYAVEFDVADQQAQQRL